MTGPRKPTGKPAPKRRSTPRVAGRSPSSTAPTGTSTAPADTSTAPTESSTAPTGTSTAPTDTSTKPAATPTKPAGKTRPVSRVSTIKPSAPPPTPGPEDKKRRLGRGPGRVRAATPSGRFSARLAATLGGIALLLGIFALIAGLHPGASIGANKAFVDQAATTELTSQAQDKVCVAIAANGTDVDAWSKKARAALTGKALAEFDKYLPQQKQILQQTKAVADCRVDALGVSNLSGDGDGSTATIVANMIISESQNGQATNSGVPRVQFAMVKKGDQWLISEVEPF